MKTLKDRLAALELSADKYRTHGEVAREGRVILSIRDELDPIIPEADLAHYLALEQRTVDLAVSYAHCGWGVMRHPAFTDMAIDLFTVDDLNWILEFADRYLSPEMVKPTGLTYLQGEVIRAARRMVYRQEWAEGLGADDATALHRIEACGSLAAIEGEGLYREYRRLQEALESYYAQREEEVYL